jgi:hypothetical protein
MDENNWLAERFEEVSWTASSASLTQPRIR